MPKEKTTTVQDQIAQMLRGDPTAGVYSMYVISVEIEQQR